MSRLLVAFSLAAALTTVSARAQWTDHASFAQCAFADVVCGSTFVGGEAASLFYYDSKELTLGKLSKSNRLSSAGVSALCSHRNELVVGYANGDIDIVNMESLAVSNVPELRTSDAFDNKAINAIVRGTSRYYCGFNGGVIELDPIKKEIRSTWRVSGSGAKVTDVALYGDSIYVIADGAVRCANVNSITLENPGEWNLIEEVSEPVRLELHAGRLMVAFGEENGECCVATLRADGVYAIQDTLCVVQNFSDLRSADGSLAVASRNAIITYDSKLSQTSKVTSFADKAGAKLVSSPYVVTARPLADGRIVVADRNCGLLVVNAKGVGSLYCPSGPNSNSISDLCGVGDVMYATGPSRSLKATFRFALNVYRNGSWQRWANGSNEAVSVVVDRRQTSEVYVSTYGAGIYKVEQDGIGVNYNQHNSTLTDIFGGSGFVRVDMMAFDPKHNLYCCMPVQENGISIFSPDGSWSTLSYGDLAKNGGSNAMIATRNGNVWIALGGSKLMIFNVNQTPEDPSDDAYLSTSYHYDSQFSGKFSLEDESSGEGVGSEVRALAEDRDGRVWVGTNAGLLVCSNDRRLFVDNKPSLNRVRVPRNDGTNLADYLLDAVTINDIEVDGANRKWIATQGDGLYLVSDDGYKTIHHFTAANSGIASDNVLKVAVRPSDGEVFVLTDIGLQSYKGDASEPVQKMDDVVKVYPNPVSLSSNMGYVTINGMEFGSHVFITDVAGNRLFRAESHGGSIRWELRKNGGERVVPGVYIVWVTNTDRSSTAIGKILVKD